MYLIILYSPIHSTWSIWSLASFELRLLILQNIKDCGHIKAGIYSFEKKVNVSHNSTIIVVVIGCVPATVVALLNRKTPSTFRLDGASPEFSNQLHYGGV